MKNCSQCQDELTDDNWWVSWKRQKTNICKVCGRLNNKKYDTKDVAKNRKLKTTYNISLVDYNTMLDKQNFKCAICNTDVPLGKGNFKVDHCHISGKVRGLLCHHCNVGIGHFKDDPSLLIKAIKYLGEQYEKNN